MSKKSKKFDLDERLIDRAKELHYSKFLVRPARNAFGWIRVGISMWI